MDEPDDIEPDTRPLAQRIEAAEAVNTAKARRLALLAESRSVAAFRCWLRSRCEHA
jgi:hypothetical protein